MEPQTHFLKCLAPYFDAVERGEKPFEVRKNDRGYQPGDIVVLVRIEADLFSRDASDAVHLVQHPDERTWVARNKNLRRRIGWLLQGGQFGIEPAYCVFALEPVSASASSHQQAALAGTIQTKEQSDG